MPRSTLDFIVVLAIGLGVGCTRSPPLEAGDWVGDLDRPDGADRLEVTVDSGGRRITVTAPAWKLEAAPAMLVRRAGDSIEVAALGGSDTARFRGVATRTGFGGRARRGSEQRAFDLRRIRRFTDAEWAEIVGTYRAKDGRLIGVAPFAEFGPGIRLFDYQTGRVGPLLPLADTMFLVGHSVIAPILPVDTLHVRRWSRGRVEGIRWVESGQPPVEAARVATRDEDVELTNGAVSLRGTLTLPADSAPHPAIVIVHGSGPMTRDGLGPWPRFFVGLGFAVLSYDKRGTGQSTGDWRQADFAALAADVHAGVRLLERRADIRRDRIGLWGASQGGWILPLVAATWPEEIGFLIVHAGTGTTVREQGILNLQYEYRFRGASEATIATATRYRAIDDSVTRTGRGWEELNRFYQAHGALAQLWEPRPADDSFRPYYRMLMDFDPAPSWARVKVPVLLFFGELDANVPPRESWPPIERGLRRAGNHHFIHYVLPKANHLLLEARTGAATEYPGLSRFVPGYFDRMAEWLRVEAARR